MAENACDARLFRMVRAARPGRAAHARGAGTSPMSVPLSGPSFAPDGVAAAALRGAEAHVAGVLETAMDPVIVADAAQRIVLFNASAERVFGWSRDAIIGQPLAVLVPAALRDVHRGHVARFGATGESARRMGRQQVLAALRADGSEFPIEASISHHREQGGEFYTAIVRDISERMRVEHELKRSQQDLQALALAAHETREDEQRRIARELHDELGQSITALKMMVASMQTATTPDPDRDRARLARMQSLLDETFASIRRMTSELRPLILDDLGLEPALERLTESLREHAGIACSLSVDARGLELDDTERTAVYRIVQEALTNVVRHAHARHADVRLARAGAALRLQIDDDGAGFAVGAQRADARGLRGMRERVQLLGGTLAVDSAPGRGTRLAVQIPLRGAETRR
jgi:PAS domain S-box-containing protein